MSRTMFGTGVRGGHHLVPEILGIGWGSFPEADPGHLRAHTHGGAYEVCLILGGEVEWETAAGCEILRTGDVFITRPDELHWGRDAAMHPCELHWLILDQPHHTAEWLGLAPRTRDTLTRGLAAIAPRRLRATAAMREAMSDVYRAHAETSPAPRVSEDFRPARARLATARLLLEMVGASAPGDCRDAGPPDPLARTIEALLAAPGKIEAKNVREVCRELGFDHDRLNAYATATLGSSLPQLWLRERIRRSRDWLTDGRRPIIDVALAFGFSSSQHYATAFRKVTGMTPTAYREHHDPDPPGQMKRGKLPA